NCWKSWYTWPWNARRNGSPSSVIFRSQAKTKYPTPSTQYPANEHSLAPLPKRQKQSRARLPSSALRQSFVSGGGRFQGGRQPRSPAFAAHHLASQRGRAVVVDRAAPVPFGAGGSRCRSGVVLLLG